MAFPTKKPGVSVSILGIGGPKPPPEGGPPPFSGAPKAAPEPPKPDDGSDDEAGEGIPPEAVSFRDGSKKCSSCEYNEGGNCSKLKMPVQPDDGCNLHEAKGGEGGEE